MKNFSIAFCLTLIALSSTGQIFMTEKIAQDEARHHAARVLEVQNDHLPNYDVKHYRLEITPLFDDTLFYSLTGKVTTSFVPLVQDFDEIIFDFSDALVVDSVIYNGAQLTHSSTVPDKISINFPAALPKDALDSVSVYYHGIPLRTGLGSFRFDLHQGLPVLSTLSQPYGAKDWWPCKQSLDDKADSVDILITCNQKYKVASNGLLQDIEEKNDLHTWHYKHSYPIATYLIAFACSDYTYFTDYVPLSQDTVLFENYVFPDLVNESKSAMVLTGKFMQLYDTLLSPYPFGKEKYGHAMFLAPGGMEHQTMSFMGNFHFELLAHELAHQWFGNKVTCGSWQDIWLNEGFATFLVGLAYEKVDPYWFPLWKKGLLKNITSVPYGSVYVNDTSDVQRLFNARLTYQKGSYILQMLRWKLGDYHFFAGLRSYLNDPALEYNFTRVSDFIYHMERQSKTDLTKFFKDWYYGEGFPIYEPIVFQSIDNVQLTLMQSTSHPSVDFFELPVAVLFKSNNGMDSTIVFDHLFSGQTWKVLLPFQVDSVILDPDNWLLIQQNSLPTNMVKKETSGIEIYPNPTNDVVYLKTNGGEELESIQISDLKGAILLDLKKPADSLIDLKLLSNGVYFIRCENANGVFVQKLIKQ